MVLEKQTLNFMKVAFVNLSPGSKANLSERIINIKENFLFKKKGVLKNVKSYFTYKQNSYLKIFDQ